MPVHANSLIFFYREDIKLNLLESINRMDALILTFQQLEMETTATSNLMGAVVDALADENAILWKCKFLLLFIISFFLNFIIINNINWNLFSLLQILKKKYRFILHLYYIHIVRARVYAIVFHPHARVLVPSLEIKVSKDHLPV